MIKEETPLPLARMATIRKPTFWFFLAGCTALYIYNKVASPSVSIEDPYIFNGLLIFIAVFIALFLNLIGLYQRSKKATTICTITGYVFEALSLVLIGLKIYFKW